MVFSRAPVREQDGTEREGNATTWGISGDLVPGRFTTQKCMRPADCQSAYFPRFVNTYSEKSSKFDRLPVNRLASCSEWGADARPTHIQGGVVPKPPANFTRLDPGRSDVGMLIGAMLRAREVIATKSWSTSQEPTSEHWWADVLADPRARIWRQARGFYGRDGRRTAQKSCYRLADDPSPAIEVACSKCERKGAFRSAELLACTVRNAPCPPCSIIWRCLVASKINTHWDRRGVYYINPIERRKR